MALNSLIRRVCASKLSRVSAPFAIQSCRILSALNRSCGNGFPSALHHYSTGLGSIGHSLLVNESEYLQKPNKVPEDFPFDLDDRPGQNSVTLSRQYKGETITIEVGLPKHLRFKEEEEVSNGDVDEGSGFSFIPLLVKVSKNKGRVLQFGGIAQPDKILITSISLNNPDHSKDQNARQRHNFADLNDNLRRTFYEYLQIRGLKPSTAKSLHEYMSIKNTKETILWLKKALQFLES